MIANVKEINSNINKSTLARRPLWHSGTRGTQFSKLHTGEYQNH